MSMVSNYFRNLKEIEKQTSLFLIINKYLFEEIMIVLTIFMQVLQICCVTESTDIATEYDIIPRENAYDLWMKRKLRVVPTIIFGEAVVIRDPSTPKCRMQLKVICLINGKSNETAEYFCGGVEPESFPPRQSLVFFIRDRAIWRIFAEENVRSTILSKCRINILFEDSTAKNCMLLQEMHQKSKCWETSSMSCPFCILDLEDKKIINYMVIAFFLLLLIAFVSNALFQWQLSLGESKYYI